MDENYQPTLVWDDDSLVWDNRTLAWDPFIRRVAPLVVKEDRALHLTVKEDRAQHLVLKSYIRVR